jgi:hypothetical protein
VVIVHQVAASLCNLAISDENKYEISKSGALAPLITLMHHPDMGVASQVTATMMMMMMMVMMLILTVFTSLSGCYTAIITIVVSAFTPRGPSSPSLSSWC